MHIFVNFCEIKVNPFYLFFISYNSSAADQTQTMQDQMSGAASSMPQDSKAAFKAEWEALEITEYQFVLQNVETELMNKENITGNSVNQNNVK